MCSFHKLELSTCHKVKLEFKTLRSEPVPTHSWNVFVCGHIRSTLVPEVFLDFSPYEMRSREAANASREAASFRGSGSLISYGEKSRITSGTRVFSEEFHYILTSHSKYILILFLNVIRVSVYP